MINLVVLLSQKELPVITAWLWTDVNVHLIWRSAFTFPCWCPIPGNNMTSAALWVGSAFTRFRERERESDRGAERNEWELEELNRKQKMWTFHSFSLLHAAEMIHRKNIMGEQIPYKSYIVFSVQSLCLYQNFKVLFEHLKCCLSVHVLWTQSVEI